MTIPDYMAERLTESGVRHVFGVPGGPSLPYMEAFRKGGIEFVLTSHESAAGVMADVSARLNGVPGVSHATYGPGAANLLTGAGLSLLDRTPHILLTSEMPDVLLNRTVQMNVSHQELFGPVTKKTYRLSRSNVAAVMDDAFRTCFEEYPGPVHIGLPSDLATAEVFTPHAGSHAADDLSFDNDIQNLIALLEKARRPLLAIGLTAARFGLKRKILELLSSCPMPVVLTPMAKGLVPEDHPCYCGVLFHALSDYLDDIYEKTDLVIGLGYDPVEYNYESWMPGVPLVQFGTVESDMPEGVEVVKYTGSPAEWFVMLAHLNPSSVIFESAVARGIRDEIASVFEGFLGHFGPVSALKILREELPADTFVTGDVGSHLHLLGQYWQTPSPDRLIITNGWSSMGFSIPAANSVQLNRPGSRVAAITGDGGFLMSAGELMTARRYNLPVKIIVMSDGELNLIRLKQIWKEINPYGTSIYDGHLFSSDSFLGIRVLNAENELELRHCVRTALGLAAPVIVNAVIDPDDYKWLVVKQK
ncbi:MAG TPA: thiamine pyrophosphate-binding protein [Bacteroidales bacterium]|nr:thiamine pyrophosphate-binding protein [Bacteroidales bacterium]